MAVNDAALVAKVSQVLLSPECQRINFRWGKMHVNAKAYRAIVFAIGRFADPPLRSQR